MPTENVMKTTATEPVVGATTGSTAQPAIGSPIRASGELESDSKRLNSTTEEAADACQGFDWVTVRKTEPISQPSPDFNQRTAHQLSAENGAEALKDISLTKMDSAEDLEQEFALRFERSKGQTSSCDGNEWQSLSASSPEVGKKLFRNHKNEALSTVEILRCLRAFELTFGKYPHCAPEDVEFTTAESEHMVATILSLEYYQKCMEEICALNSHYVAPESLEELHCIVRKSALGIFESIPKTKNAEVSAIMLQKLRMEIDKNFSRFHVHNETKRMMQTLRTPLFLSSSVATIFSVSRGVTSLGLGLLADFFFLVGGLLLLAVLIWIYTRVTGDLQELGDSIDNSVNRAWEEISWQVEKFMIRCCVSLGPILKTTWKEDSLLDPAVPDLRSKPEKSESF